MSDIPRSRTGLVLAGGTRPWKSILLLVVLLSGCLAVSASAQDESAAAPEITAAFGVDLDRESRTLIGEGVEFASDAGQIYCMTRIKGLQGPTTVTHAWYYEGQAKARVELKVGSSDWRTWSSKKILPAWTGNWEVKVLDETGKVLATFGFTVK